MSNRPTYEARGVVVVRGPRVVHVSTTKLTARITAWWLRRKDAA